MCNIYKDAVKEDMKVEQVKMENSDLLWQPLKREKP